MHQMHVLASLNPRVKPGLAVTEQHACYLNFMQIYMSMPAQFYPENLHVWYVKILLPHAVTSAVMSVT